MPNAGLQREPDLLAIRWKPLLGVSSSSQTKLTVNTGSIIYSLSQG